MSVEVPRLKMWFEQELSSLRNEAVQFGQSFPALARTLEMSGGRSSDPHVEMLLQSFAWLAGRLRYQLEVDQAVLPNALLGILYPHLEAPLPSMMIGEIDVRSDGANFAHGATLERDRYVYALATNDLGQQVRCRFRTCYDTPLWPLRIAGLDVVAANTYPLDASDTLTASVICARIARTGKEPVHAMNMSSLRLCINAEHKQAYALYDALSLHLVRMAVRIPSTGELRYLDANQLTWCGFDENQAVLGINTLTHPGYRLLQEYFAFPQKFMFFDVAGMDLAGVDEEWELLFLLDDPFLVDVPATREDQYDTPLLKLNCLPLINLFRQRIEPFALDQAHYEYRVIGDEQNHRYCEIYRIEELVSLRPDRSPRPVAPYFSLDNFQQMDKLDYFYATRREVNQTGAVHGTETFVSFLDAEFDITLPADELIGGTALCTNRRLPQQLLVGTVLYLEGAGPVSSLRVASKPTPNQPPQMVGERPWALVSQLCLNHLSLIDGDRGPPVLKNMLRLHVGPASLTGFRQIDGIRSLSSRRVQRRMPRREAWRGFVDCLQVRAQVDPGHFEGGSAVLFGSVLHRFLALYSEVNTVVELVLETSDRRGELKSWEPLTGAQVNL
ncbi:type VI secretion system protein ImpG [Luteibacter sp. Sphag1AF]|uniref:type VI secretion system baseplate subunit TssF n=1 Tax=Luteibacter sp. Sphag1AF TaxID=2587031 RepID=UPI00160E6EEC|nr:type VI secretion system baseplate subunit TssF [Luteibacter sp. Sphag1AF]MBB3228066.1 type VI secretion system protein ImpG [Luteibacter sp. Sphag1AF]